MPQRFLLLAWAFLCRPPACAPNQEHGLLASLLRYLLPLMTTAYIAEPAIHGRTGLQVYQDLMDAFRCCPASYCFL